MKHDKNHRPIACPDCDENDPNPTMLTAWVSDWLLEREGVDSIDEIPDSDIYRFRTTVSQECSIEGHCIECNG